MEEVPDLDLHSLGTGLLTFASSCTTSYWSDSPFAVSNWVINLIFLYVYGIFKLPLVMSTFVGSAAGSMLVIYEKMRHPTYRKNTIGIFYALSWTQWIYNRITYNMYAYESNTFINWITMVHVFNPKERWFCLLIRCASFLVAANVSEFYWQVVIYLMWLDAHSFMLNEYRRSSVICICAKWTCVLLIQRVLQKGGGTSFFAQSMNRGEDWFTVFCLLVLVSNLSTRFGE